MDKEFDSAILELNRRYQEACDKNNGGKLHNINRYLMYLRKGQFGQIVKDLKYRKYALSHFTAEGNKNFELTSSVVNTADLKIAVYSCIVGHYDRIIEPLYKETGIDYFMFTDLTLPETSKWSKIDVTQFEEYYKLTPAQMNRRIKMLPFRYLPEYDYSIYVDGNIEIIAPMSPLIEEMGNSGLGVHYHNYRDCIYDEIVAIEHYKKIDLDMAKEQLRSYEKEGFPHHFGLYENGILIRRHADNSVQDLMKKWWEEYLKYPTRDQFSLPYLVWRSRFDRSGIHIIGNNLNRNLRFNREILHT